MPLKGKVKQKARLRIRERWRKRETTYFFTLARESPGGWGRRDAECLSGRILGGAQHRARALDVQSLGQCGHDTTGTGGEGGGYPKAGVCVCMCVCARARVSLAEDGRARGGGQVLSSGIGSHPCPQICLQVHPPALPQSPQGFVRPGDLGRQVGSLGLLGKTGRAEAGTGEG